MEICLWLTAAYTSSSLCKDYFICICSFTSLEMSVCRLLNHQLFELLHIVNTAWMNSQQAQMQLWLFCLTQGTVSTNHDFSIFVSNKLMLNLFPVTVLVMTWRMPWSWTSQLWIVGYVVGIFTRFVLVKPLLFMLLLLFFSLYIATYSPFF